MNGNCHHHVIKLTCFSFLFCSCCHHGQAPHPPLLPAVVATPAPCVPRLSRRAINLSVTNEPTQGRSPMLALTVPTGAISGITSRLIWAADTKNTLTQIPLTFKLFGAFFLIFVNILLSCLRDCHYIIILVIYL